MKTTFIIILCLISLALHAETQDLYGLETSEQLHHFQELTESLRCVVCQNQSLADSNADLAKDMRYLVAQQIKQGNTDQAIVAYLEQRYGNYVCYRPPFILSTYCLWLLPIVLLLTGSFIIFKLTKRERQP